ncbi:hypothetical protein [Burkholderia ubonensis]|uniref:hypothetical protein n=1 Tax=Burkholderia ubonensis TaxID=101571 RepID=UPI000759335E|nr:hypothetical protein [Burkholderia ubonensis]KVS36838.1 hypothetical protein WK37_30890 [Burkholderia ubonensis]KVS47684.1 hypothetical protein WK38_21745 [Burkholderia ubonensis]KVS70996.1 hypothetical protein WK42_26810 [Burkholderia ubonensis]KVS83229.1 hypothetical protein WK44_02965 [Burkholderia ubonensis]KVS93137.1 hypothetical protein WK43_12025 [Burkholderia ubonensis]
MVGTREQCEFLGRIAHIDAADSFPITPANSTAQHRITEEIVRSTCMWSATRWTGSRRRDALPIVLDDGHSPMKMRDLATHVDFEAVVERDDFSRAARDVLAQAIEQGGLDERLRCDWNLDEYTRIGMSGLLALRIRLFDEQGREHHGFVEAKAAVDRLDDDEPIVWFVVDTVTHLVVSLITVADYAVIGCMSLRRVKRNELGIALHADGLPLARTTNGERQ